MPDRRQPKFIPPKPDAIEKRLLLLAGAFLGLSGIVLTLAPAVRAHDWAVSYRWTHWIGLVLWAAFFGVASRIIRRKLPVRDPYLVPITALLTGWGLLVIFRLSTYFGLRQSIWLALGVLLITGLAFLKDPLDLLKRYKYIWLTGGLLLTALTFIFGVYPGGSGPTLWIGLGGLYLQPSEPLKLLLIIFMAAYLAERLPEQFSLSQTLVPLGLAFLAALALLIGQRDLGTASLIIILFAVILYFATDRLRVLLVSGLLLLAGGGLGYLFFDVVRLRVDAWMNPWLDPSGNSYQVVQSLIAVASGGIFGSGLGLGSPGLVPVALSDFIFSAIAEEGGLLGCLVLLLIFALLIQRGFRIAISSSDLFTRYLAGGISTYLALQSILIIGGNIRVLPITGVTLPFISYGGSSLVTSMLAAGILLCISVRTEGSSTTPSVPARPFRITAALLWASFALLALGCGWWSVIRNENLISRTDNFRRSINDRYVLRGRILDRNDNVLSQTVGESGAYTRQLTYPDLSPIVGYTNPSYGQAGLEAAMDEYLRGVRGYPALQQALNNLLYNQPPEGLDVRVSLSLALQEKADELLGETTGAIVLMNPESGEILAMASHPGYDANTLESDIERLEADQDAPLLNRTTQALYPAGTSLSPFLLAVRIDHTLPETPAITLTWLDGRVVSCAMYTPPDAGWGALITNGCPSAAMSLTSTYDGSSLAAFYEDLDLFVKPAVPLDADFNEMPDISPEFVRLALGVEGVDVSPLQLALAASTISAGGIMPAPRLALSVNTPESGWVILPVDGEPRQVFTPEQADLVAELLKVKGQPYWQSLGTAGISAERTLTWCIGGTLPGWSTPVVAVVLVEEDAAGKARYIHRSLILAAQ